MTGKHVVSAGSNPLQRHTGPRPNNIGVVQLVPNISIRPRLTLQMGPGDAERRDQHCHASKHENGATDGEKSSHQNETVLVKQNH